MPTGFDQTTIERIQQALDIVEVVSEYVKLTKKGREYVGLCPFHDDHRPSMTVSPAKQIFKCFSCGMGGSVIKFVQKQENLTFGQAVRRLAERAGIAIEDQRPRSVGRSEGTAEGDPVQLTKVNEWACRFFQSCLGHQTAGQAGRAYLRQRGLDRETVEDWRLGLAPRDGVALAQAARRQGIADLWLRQAGLIDARGRDRFVNRLMFPIRDATGRVIAFGGRTLADDPAKYINSPATPLFDKSRSLFGVYQARHGMVERSEAVVVEGYTDCIMAHQAGVTHVVATLGTSLTEGHAWMLKRYARRRVILVFDGDVAGIRAANRAIEVCLRCQIDMAVACLPDGLDPCDFIVERGGGAFRQILDEALDVFEFKWRLLLQQTREDGSLIGQKTACEEYLEAVATGLVQGRVGMVERGLLVKRLAAFMGLSAAEVGDELARRCRRLRRRDGETTPESTEASAGQCPAAVSRRRFAIEREMMEVLLNAPRLYRDRPEEISFNSFETPMLRQIGQVLADLLEERRDIDCRDVLRVLESRDPGDEMARWVTDLVQQGQAKGNFRERWALAQEAWFELNETRSSEPSQREGDIETLRLTRRQGRRGHSLGLVNLDR